MILHFYYQIKKSIEIYNLKQARSFQKISTTL